VDAPRYCYRHPDRETGLSCFECGRPICYECMTAAPVGLRCPEHSGKAQGVQKVTRGVGRAVSGVGSRRVNAVTMALIGINVAVYALELAAGGTISGTGNWIFNHGSLFASGVYVPGGVATLPAHANVPAGFSAAFLHYGPFHLAINMYSLYFAGTLLEAIIGRWRFALLYIGSGIAGSAGAIWLSPNQVTVGASGAIFGILGALFILERRNHIATGGQVAGLIVLNLVFTFLFRSSISLGGHVGGLIGGLALMALLLQTRRSAWLSVAATGVVIVASLALAYSRTRGYS
jgi:membrane associated rhomboid family serine protease